MAKSLSYIRKLTITLMISGTLNVFLLILFFYFTLSEHLPIPYYEMKPATTQEQLSPLAIDHSNQEVIRYFKKMPFEWLIARLSNTQLVENGYTQRDLALASLMAFHHLDVDRALSTLPSPGQKRSLIYGRYRDGSPAELMIYSGLSDRYCDAIRAFASTERWPMTPKGLFLTLKKQSFEGIDPSLADAFYMTSEFLSAETLLSRSGTSLEKSDVLAVLLDGSWGMLMEFSNRQKAIQDLSAAKRQQFLLNYIDQQSKSAALLLLKIDEGFTSRQLDDSRVLVLLGLLDKKTPESERFALALLTSPRSEPVWNAAARRLYDYAGESQPEKNHHYAALSRFVPEHQQVKVLDKPTLTSAPPIIPPPPAPIKSAVKAKESVAANPPIKAKVSNSLSETKKIVSKEVKTDRVYIVQEGDSLWKVSRRFNVDIERLKIYNHLDSNNLRPGRSLKIPAQRF